MLDAGQFWRAPRDLAADPIEGRDWRARLVSARQVLISGDVIAGLLAFAPGIAPRGPHETGNGPTHAIRLGIDRVLLVRDNDPTPVDSSGWNDAGFAATDVTEALTMIALEGPAAFDVLARGTGVDLRVPPTGGVGAAGLIFGEIRLIAWRHGAGDLRLCVETSRAAALVDFLDALVPVV